MTNISENTLKDRPKSVSIAVPARQAIVDHARKVTRYTDNFVTSCHQLVNQYCFIMVYFIYYELERFAFIPSHIEQQVAESLADAEFDEFLKHLEKDGYALFSEKSSIQQAEESANNCEKTLDEIRKILKDHNLLPENEL